MQTKIAKFVNSKFFEHFIIAVILISAVLIGIETIKGLSEQQQQWIVWGNRIILSIFVVEAALKIYAVAPQFKRYFGDGWNLFDFSIVVFSLIPFTGQFAMIGRLLRLLRVARLVSALPELRLIVSTLLKTIPSMIHVVLLMAVLFYIYGVAGYHFFHQTNPDFWGSLGTSLLTLFRVVTLEGWTQVMYLDLADHQWAWLYYVSFIVVGTFIIVNLFIALVINNLDEVKQQKAVLERTEKTEQDILANIVVIREKLQELEKDLHPSVRK
ncbi:ion transporter [Kangiella sp. TOML190]|uniref:ion transporter n=1 Tax=Kangiella sp. TOML190 TaxID=2931351 RepID=UPI00203AE0AE|nr:ion transporter [Kangiella sp. TOML190]